MEVRTPERLGATVSLRDLEVVSKAVMLRLDDPDQEERRVNRMRELLWAASELVRALSAHAQHALVDCCGTHGTGDLGTATRALHRALGTYAQLVESVASEYRDIVPAGGAQPDARSPQLRSTAAAGAL